MFLCLYWGERIAGGLHQNQFQRTNKDATINVRDFQSGLQRKTQITEHSFSASCNALLHNFLGYTRCFWVYIKEWIPYKTIMNPPKNIILWIIASGYLKCICKFPCGLTQWETVSLFLWNEHIHIISKRERERDIKNKLVWPNVSDIILGFLA